MVGGLVFFYGFFIVGDFRIIVKVREGIILFFFYMFMKYLIFICIKIKLYI